MSQCLIVSLMERHSAAHTDTHRNARGFRKTSVILEGAEILPFPQGNMCFASAVESGGICGAAVYRHNRETAVSITTNGTKSESSSGSTLMQRHTRTSDTELSSAS